MAAPWVLLWKLNKTSCNRIQVDIPYQAQQISIVGDEQCAVTSFEHMTRAFTPAVKITGISRHQPAHQPRQRLVRNLNCSVDMICHPTESMQSARIPLKDFCHEVIQAVPIFIPKEYRFTGIAAQNDVINSTRNMNARSSGHL